MEEMDQLIAAVSRVRLSSPTSTANEVYETLRNESEWASVLPADVRKACSKAAKRTAKSTSTLPASTPELTQTAPHRYRGGVIFASSGKFGVLHRKDRVVSDLGGQYLQLLLRDDVGSSMVFKGMPCRSATPIDAAWASCKELSKAAYEREAARLNNAEIVPVLELDGDGVHRLHGCEVRLTRAIQAGAEITATWGWEYWDELGYMPLENASCAMVHRRAKLNPSSRQTAASLAVRRPQMERSCRLAVAASRRSWQAKLTSVPLSASAPPGRHTKCGTRNLRRAKLHRLQGQFR
mmetsp:Transcript_46774/g.155027  ORF Transcript_46774/g.155027 Transcript_46774/m.155027 type:complete len:294 (-) Transcript_46774:980-1861(-)